MSVVVHAVAPAASPVRCWSRGLVLHGGHGSGGRGFRRALASRRPPRSPAGAAVRRWRGPGTSAWKTLRAPAITGAP